MVMWHRTLAAVHASDLNETERVSRNGRRTQSATLLEQSISSYVRRAPMTLRR
jgi:hypothetical protein